MSGTSDYTLTPNLGLYKPNYNADVDNWGFHLNDNADTLDAAVGAGSANVRSHGAVGDGVTNDTAAFNAAMAASKMVVVPTGTYLLDPISVPAGVALCGAVPGPMDPSPGFLTTPIGATLLVNSHGSPFITLNASSALCDVIIYDPNQVPPTATAPTVVPATVDMASVSRMRGVTICNGYIGVTVGCGRCRVENCYIGAYLYGVSVDKAHDVTYFDKVWVGPFYDSCLGLFPWQNMDTWVINNQTTGFLFAEADAVTMTNCGSFIRWAGIQFLDGAAGNSYGWCSNHNADTCIYGIIANSTNAANGWQLSNFTALPTQAGAQAATPLYMSSGGGSAPYINWNGGAIGLPNYWTSPSPIVDAGKLQIHGVDTMQDYSAFGSNWGSQTGASNTDFSKHIALHVAGGYGIGVTSLRVNYVVGAGGAAHVFMSNGVDQATIANTQVTFNPPCELSNGVGLFGATPVSAKPTVTGAKGGNAALTSLLAALSAYGLVHDTTT